MEFRKQGLYQALGVVGYISLIATLMQNIERMLGRIEDSFLAPIAFLTLFSTSALICGLIVFYNPYKLFFDGKKKEAIEIVLSTAISLFVILVLLFSVIILGSWA